LSRINFDCHYFQICYYGTNNSHQLFKGAPMTTAEKISIALPPEMVHIVRGAVATGEYASNSEVIRDALRDWTYKRSLRQQGVAELRRVWQEALNDKSSSISPDDVLDRLERKYQAIADGAIKTP
jgi:antitoxin ParD1/3/4